MRINRFIAQSGYCSRRKADELISAGKVTVNGKSVEQLGIQIDPQKDQVSIEGKVIHAPLAFTYLILNKPAGYTTTRSDIHAKQTVYELLPHEYHRLHPVGRLDKNSEGLLLMTDDGDYTYQLTHPKHGCSKTYEVHVRNIPSQINLQKLQNGIDIKEERDGEITTYHTQPCHIVHKRDRKIFHITIHEGRKRQVRKMFNEIKCPVVYLKRLTMGPYSLGTLKRGQFVPVEKL